MADRPSPTRVTAGRPGIHESVFAQLVGVMATMAATLLMLVAGFFWLIVRPAVVSSIDRLLEGAGAHDRRDVTECRRGRASERSPRS